MSFTLSSVRGLLVSAGIYTASSVLNKSVAFLLLPVLTRLLTPAEYGHVTMFLTLHAMLSVLVGMNMNSVLFQRYYRLPSEERPCLVNDIYKIMLVAASGAGLLVLALLEPIGRLTGLPAPWALAAVPCALAGMIFTISSDLIRIRKQPLVYAVLQNTNTLANLGLSLLLVAGLGYSWQGRLTAFVGTTLAFALVCLWLNGRHGEHDLTKLASARHFKESARLGLMLLPGACTAIALTQSDRLFLASLNDLSAVGVYAVGASVSMLIDVLVSSIGSAWNPFFFEKIRGADRESQIRLVQGTYLLAAIYLLAGALLGLVSPFLIGWVLGEKFAGAASVIGWLSLAYALQSVGGLFSLFLLDAGKNSLISTISFLAMLVNIGLNLTLIPLNGMIGAAQASLGSCLCTTTLTLLLAARVQAMPWLSPELLRLTPGKTAGVASR